MSTTDVEAAAFLPTDGYIDPASVTQAIARGARQRGAAVCENTPVVSITVDGRRCTSVHTATGHAVECETVVNAAGMWGMEVGRMVGARVPAVAVEHQYLLSGPIDGYTPVELGRMPTMRDPDHLVYYKPDGPGLLVRFDEITDRDAASAALRDAYLEAMPEPLADETFYWHDILGCSVTTTSGHDANDSALARRSTA